MRGDRGTLLLYDRDCGFCTWSARMIRAMDHHSRIAAIPIQSREGDHVLRRMAPAARLASMHVVTPDGTVRSGGEALPALLRPLPGGAVPAGLLAAMPRTTDASYRFVARHRGTLGRLLGRSA